MAEHVQRYRQYEYRANSNLVLTADTHRQRTDEPSGEPESLKEHLDGTKFGGSGQPSSATGNVAMFTPIVTVTVRSSLCP